MIKRANLKLAIVFLLLFFTVISCSGTPQIIPTENNLSAPLSPETFSPTQKVILTTTPTTLPQQTFNFDPVYPQLPGKGVTLTSGKITNISSEYKEIIYLVDILNQYYHNHPEMLRREPTPKEKEQFRESIISTIATSEYSGLLDRKYYKSKTETLDFNYYLDEFVVKFFNFYNQSSGKNEFIQCLGWQPFIGDLIFSHHNGMSVAALGHYSLDFPNGIIYVKNHGDIHIAKPKNFDDIQKGDTYIYSRHTGIILNVYRYNDKLYYLITESNSPKGAESYYEPTGNPIIYLADQTKFIQAIGFGDIYIARPNNRYQISIPPETPSGDILNIIQEIE